MSATEGAIYRVEADDEPVLEARERDLPPAASERLREACERHEAHAGWRPLASGRARNWLLAALVPPSLACPIVFETFDRLPYGAMVAGVLTALAAWVLGCVALAARSWWLWRGTSIAPGRYLFTTGLLEVSGGRLRLWPTERARIDQRGSDVLVALGPHGRCRLVTSLPDVALSLARSRERLARTRAEGDEASERSHDPLAVDRTRGWGAVAGPARLPEERPWRGVAVVAAAAVLGALGLYGQLRSAVATIAIRSAVEQNRPVALQGYVLSGGLKADEADEAWLDLITRSGDDGALLAYLQTPYARHKDQADQRLASRVLGPGVAPGWIKRWRGTGAAMYSDGYRGAEPPAELPIDTVEVKLTLYGDVRPQRLDETREQLIRLRYLNAAAGGCDQPLPALLEGVPPEDALRAPFREEQRTVLEPYFYLRRGERCQSLIDLARACGQAGPPALLQQAGDAFARRRAAMHEESRQALERLPGLADLVAQARAYLPGHRDWASFSKGGDGDPLCLRRDLRRQESRPLVVVSPFLKEDDHRHLERRVERVLLDALGCTLTPPGGLRLEFRPLSHVEKKGGGRPVEVTLTLPGQPAQRRTMEL